MKELLEHWKLEVIVHMPRASFPELLELWIEVTINHLTEGKQLSVAARICYKGVLHVKCQCD